MSEPHRPPEQHDEASRVLVLVLGAALVVVGLFFLGRQWFPGWLPVSITNLWSTIRGLGWGLGLIIIGVLVIALSQRKGFTPPAKGTRLYRSRSNKMVSGVFGGLAEYLKMDATLIRLVYAGLALLFDLWPAVVAYIIASIIVPEEPEAAQVPAAAPPAPAPAATSAPAPPAPPPPLPPVAPAPAAPAPAAPAQPADPVPPATVDPAPAPGQDAGVADE